MPPTPLDADETLAGIGHRIHCSFGSLTADARSHKDEDAFFSALVNESQRFGLWAKNLGLYNLGHSSLDYRFRDAPTIHQYTRHILVDLENSILKIQQNLSDQKTGRDIIAVQAHTSKGAPDQAAGLERDSDEAPASDESSEDEEDLITYQEASISGIVLENAKLMIDRLYKISFKIRNPATRLGFSKARSYRALDEETGVDLMEQYACFDLRHVAEIVAPYWGMSPGQCESHDVVQRLAKANTNRRRQFGQWRRHKLKLESVGNGFVKMMDKNPKLVAGPSLLQIPQGSQRGALSLPSTATTFDEKNINLDDNASAISSSTYAIRFAEENENNVGVPPLPEKLCTDKEFECPRHVFKDLRPYVCTYEDCAEGDQQYDNFRDWVSHEVNTHHDAEWRSASPSRLSLEDRGISLGSSKSSSQLQPPKLLTPNDTSRQKCPICLEENPTFHHIGLHLLKLALFALPNSVGPDEDTIMGDQDSNIANVDDLVDLDDQDSMLSWKTFEKVGMGSLHEDEKDGNWHEGDPETSNDGAPTGKTTREDVRRFKNALQHADNSNEKGLSIKISIAGLEPDNTLPYGKEGNNDRPAFEVGGAGIVETLSFFVRIDHLAPNYQAQSAQHGPHGFWFPPSIKTGYITRGTNYFRWLNGSMTHYPANVPIHQTFGPDLGAATVFTHSPDTPHLLVVPFDARLRHVIEYPGGWTPLVFRHVSIGKTQRSYSSVEANGDRQHIAAPGSPHWMPQLLPRIYDCQSEDPRLQAGLIGSIPLLIALAAFSAPPTFLSSILTSCLQLGRWLPHQYPYPMGHIAERGMVVTIYYDPSNPQGSNADILNKLESGHFGPFYS